MNKLVIVESPTKARTISKFLGKGFKIESSFGHIRDLPQSNMGVDIEHGFTPKYVIPKKSQKHVTALKKLAKSAPTIILATDEDREGEAISWHLIEALGLGNSKSGTRNPQQVQRIVFHEITKAAIEHALKNPRELDMNLVDAQQARRVLDRLVGYELSPFLWKKIKYGLSAGRVQSVALRLIVEREREIGKFKTQEYWTVEALLKKDDAPDTQRFTAKLIEVGGQSLKKFDISTKAAADEIVKSLKQAQYKVADVRKKEARRSPAAPFTTSTLQQEASRKLGLSARQTMMIAQKLYETGYITYMRTDSVNLSEEALRQAQEVIESKYGKNYSGKTRRYKTKSKGAQEAHEAIRPTDLRQDTEILEGTLEPRDAKLYDLIWKRTVASQMPEAVFDQTSVDIKTTSPQSTTHNLFRATGQVIKFDGFIKVYTEGRDEDGDNNELADGELPKLTQDEILELLKLDGVQHFTEPPPRYTDASLIKALEEFGIGRPSTYAPTISTILERGYVERKERKFFPSQIGLLVNDLLVEHFAQIVDYEFTAKMEAELDDIAEGKLKWQPVIKEFYSPFKESLDKKMKTVEKQVQQTDTPCPLCGKLMIIKFGRFGQFMACSDYPTCKGKLAMPEEQAAKDKIEAELAGKKCPECLASPDPAKRDEPGDIVVKNGRFGMFLGCSRYPECKHIEKIEKKTGVACPECNTGELVEKRTRKGGRTFWGCNLYPKCKYATWQNPTQQAPGSVV